MDAKSLDFEDSIFTTVIDKGLLDAISSGYRSNQNGKSYIEEVYRVMEPEARFICVSHEGDRKETFLDFVEWADIKIAKVYKPLYEREEDLIRNEFVSEGVLDVIADKRRVQFTEIGPDEEGEREVIPYDQMPKFEKPKKMPPVID